MSNLTSRFRELLVKASQGDEQSFREIIEEFGDSIRRLARHGLNPKLRRHYDSEDVYQTVLKSFYAKRNELVRFETPDELVRYLSVMARNKLVEKFRRKTQTQSYNLDREPAMTDLQEDRPIEAYADKPTPSQIVSAKEKEREIMAGQPDQTRDVIRLRAHGAKYEEIAAMTGMNERSIRRIIKRLEKKVNR